MLFCMASPILAKTSRRKSFFTGRAAPLSTQSPQARTARNLEFEDYSVGSANRWILGHRVAIPRVRQAAERHPGVLFHTIAMTMTWLFFAADGRLQDYYLCEQ